MKKNNINGRRPPLLRRFYPEHFKDFILIELIHSQKELIHKEITEKNIPLTEDEILKINLIVESRFLKYKIEFLAQLLTH